jgi:hypothetical protein
VIMAQATVVRIFGDRQHAERAIKVLKRAGFRNDQIGCALRAGVPPASDAARDVLEPGGDVASDGSTALTAGLVPGIGPTLTAGVLTGILGDAASGAVAGGLLGALVGLGVPEIEARCCVKEFQSGHPLVVVKANSRAAEAAAILYRNGVSNAQRRPGVTATRTVLRSEDGRTLGTRERGTPN